MKFEIFIDKECEERVMVYAHEKTKLTDAIEQLVTETDALIGYNGKQYAKLSFADIYCFTVEENKVFAVTENERLQLKSRLYRLEEIMPESFIKINQSCIIDTKKAERFDASVSGTLLVRLKNGYSDYVSRRNLKKVKERFGI